MAAWTTRDIPVTMASSPSSPEQQGGWVWKRRWDWRARARRSSWRGAIPPRAVQPRRSEEHTSELQSLMRISYAVFCLKKKKNTPTCTHSTSDRQLSNNLTYDTSQHIH